MSRHGGGGDDYARVGEHYLSARDVEVVDAKLKERSACKRDREYEEADAIRDLLMDRFGKSVRTGLSKASTDTSARPAYQFFLIHWRGINSNTKQIK